LEIDEMSQHDLNLPTDRLPMPARRRALFAARNLLLSAAAAPGLAAAQGSAAAVAPPTLAVMHGFADQQSITLWMQGQSAARLRVDARLADGELSRVVHTQQVELDPQADLCAQVRISALSPGQRYHYTVTLDAPGLPANVLASGSFRTQALWQWRSEPPTLKLAVGSCAYLNDGVFDRPGTPYGGGEEIFDQIAATAPDLMLWLGDNIYLREPEWTSREGINRRYRFYREHPRLQKLMSATAHVAIWDDHDFGPNDADASFVNKAWTLEMFRRYWPAPFAPRPEATYGQVNLGDVDIFMLDDRSHRYPNRWPAGPDKVMFGAAQIDWLKRALTASNAPFKLVAGGGQFFNPVSRHEPWDNFAEEQQGFLRWLDDSRVPGVIFLSGDRHFAEMVRVERAAGRYPLYELTTSPLTSSPLRRPDEAERKRPAVLPGSFVTERNFAMLTVSGPRTDRALRVELKDTQGRTLWDWQVQARALV
jgi:alkaline phosphatase D